MAENYGIDHKVLCTLNRNLAMLLTHHVAGDSVRVSDFHHVIANRGGGMVHVIDVLATMGILVDDRPPVFETWLEAKLQDLAPAIATQVRRWTRVLRDGSPRRAPRRPLTAVGYIMTARPALLTWSRDHDHLREITRENVLAYLELLRGDARTHALVALRSLFSWAKRDGVIFRDPTNRIRLPTTPRPVWLPLAKDQITHAVQAASTPQSRVCVALAAVHAARPAQIRALQLDDLDLGNRRITISGHARPLDELTYRVLLEWLDHRRARWPHTTNPHLLISKESALRLGPVSTGFIANLRGLPANLERLRIDRQLEEALTAGADPLHLAAVFGISDSAAIRYATNARHLLEDDHVATPPRSLRTRVTVPDNSADGPLGSR
jgi:hypothetical protein